MERRAADEGPAEPGRSAGLAVVEDSGEGELPGPADVGDDLIHNDDTLLGRVFEGDVAARILGPRREGGPERDVVDLDDGSVDVVGETAAHIADPVDGVKHFGRRAAALAVYDRHARLLQDIHRFRVAPHELVRSGLDVEGEEGEGALAGDPGIELSQRAGGEVAGICGLLLPLFLLDPVESVEGLTSHVDLSSDLERRVGKREGAGNRRNRQRVGGDVLAGVSVASRLGEDERHPA